jgi:hypothetical protein
MPAKRKVTTPPPKKSSKHKPAQTSIDNFFTSPSKSRNTGLKRETSVISIIDSDDDIILTGGDDEKVARELQERFDTGRAHESKDKGKAKEIEPKLKVDEEDDGIELVQEEVHAKKEGINGSSSSKVHPMFAPSTSVKTPTKPKPDTDTKNQQSPQIKLENGNGNRSPAKITTSSAEAVEPIDFDVDQFIFRPAEIDCSRWPKGRLPYSVLVGVYVQVSSTRSRLLIVRVLTK